MYIPAFLEVMENKDFRKFRKIDEGSMGEVWTCDVLSDELVGRARRHLCVAKVGKSSSERSQRAFIQEVAVMYHLRNHKNIAQIIGFSYAPLTMLMEFYPLGSLRTLIHMGTPSFTWTTQWRFHFFRDVARGLKHMHKLFIAHCDLKPANILVKQDGKKMYALLTDFGIGYILDGKPQLVAGFERNNLNGATIAYTAPEVITRFRQKKSGTATNLIKSGDVYSISILLCELICKRNPW